MKPLSAAKSLYWLRKSKSVSTLLKGAEPNQTLKISYSTLTVTVSVALCPVKRVLDSN